MQSGERDWIPGRIGFQQVNWENVIQNLSFHIPKEKHQSEINLYLHLLRLSKSICSAKSYTRKILDIFPDVNCDGKKILERWLNCVTKLM